MNDKPRATSLDSAIAERYAKKAEPEAADPEDRPPARSLNEAFANHFRATQTKEPTE